MAIAPICRITDGTTTVNFLIGVFRLNSWPPKIAQAKGGGTWQDSPLVEGRRLVARVYGNVIEEYDFQVVAGIEDLMVQEVQDFRRLLEKATAFWTTDWQDEPVWLEVRGPNETNTRYAVVYNWLTPGDADPFGIDFTQDSSPSTVLMTNWMLILERGQWRGDPPDGTSTCIELSSILTDGHTTALVNRYLAAGADDCYVTHTTQSIDTAGNILQVGVNAAQSCSIGLRFQNLIVPPNSKIQTAILIIHTPVNLAGNTCRTLISGEKNDAPAIFTTYNDFVTRDRTDNVKTYGNMIPNAAATYEAFHVENIIQEIVDMPSWDSGDDIVLFVEDNGSDNNAFRQYDSEEALPGEILLSIYYFTADYEIGRAATCDNEVIIVNKHNDVRLTHIYNDTGAGWSANLINGALPIALLPGVPVANDAIYFGVETPWRSHSGTFENIIFNLSQGVGTAVGQWEFWNGAGWTVLTETLGTINDETQSLIYTGINGVFWAKQDAAGWPLTTLLAALGGGAPAVNGHWFRFLITAAGGAPTVPTQQTVRPFTATWPEAEFQSTEVIGDMQALSQIKLFNRSARGRFLSSGADVNVLTPDLMANRAFIATRSVDRGTDFRLWLNLTDGVHDLIPPVRDGISGHNPDGTAINYLNLDTNDAQDNQATLRRSTLFNPTGVEALAERLEIIMNGEVAQAYYGSFKCFLRLRQDGGSSGDFTFRVKVRTSTAGLIFQSNIFTIDPKPAAGADENLWLLFDIGRVDMVPSQLLDSDDVMNNLSIVIELGNSNASPGDLYLSDMGFLPIDEWACDCEDYSGSNAGAIMSGLVSLRFLDIDSIGNPRRKKRLLVRGDDPLESIQATWVYRSNGISTMQSGATQRIYAILARYFESGGESFWDGNPDIASSIQAFTVPRYLAARGAR